MSSYHSSASRLIPYIRKDQREDVAEEFLQKYYPEALKTPMAVPIVKIAKEIMGLEVNADCRLTEDLSVLGEMCFSSGAIDVYYPETDEFRELEVKKGTMLIDADVIQKRNIGCFNITVAHECVHWEKHRRYYDFQNAIDMVKRIRSQSASSKVYTKARTSPTTMTICPDRKQWTDEDWMEWQANSISPRILMPRKPFTEFVNACQSDVLRIRGSNPFCLAYLFRRDRILQQIVEQFQVSRQAADIRLDELGFKI